MNAVLPVRTPPALPSRAGPAAPPPRRARPGTRRAWAFAFAVSALAHLVLFLVLRFDRTDYSELTSPATRLVAVREAVGTRVEQIQELPAGVVPEEPEPVVPPRTRFDTPPVRADLPVVREAPPAAETPARRAPTTFRELLRPSARSPEVWRAPSPIHTPLDPRAEANARVSGRLDAYNDSVALAAAQAARAVDWTRTDEDGGRWGVSPEGIHLGDITIPVPINLSPGPGKRDEVAGRVRDWGEIQAQGARQEGKETFEERVRAIRERKERERQEQKPPPPQ